MTILIGGAWPYANGSLHIGHIAGLLPGDILARYFRLKGEKVCYVSGSDCHGTPIQIRAKKENVLPENIAQQYHEEFKQCFEKLGFSYDLYNRTDDEYHKKFVQEFFIKLLDSGYIYKNSLEQAFCETCNQFLPDRFVVGTCPKCKSNARGDQCDSCGSLLDPSQLLDCRCSICQGTPIFKASEHFFLALSKFDIFVREYFSSTRGWRLNAINESEKYIGEGLKDRAITRDLKWGIDVPIDGFEGKKIYVWIDAVLGYLSTSKKWCEENSYDWNEIWSDSSLHYYVHGKDNIPFHTIILPALLKAHGNLHLPDRIVSNEYLTLEGKKISTSNNWAVWIPYLLEKYNPDSIRYFLTINAPEKRDTDFSWREFINSHNGELLGAYGNFVNRSLVFIQKYFNGIVPKGNINPDIKATLVQLYQSTGKLIENSNFKEALEGIFAFIRQSNKYFDKEQPWITLKEDSGKCSQTLFNCAQIILNLSNLLEPFLPFTSSKIFNIFSYGETHWGYSTLASDLQISKVEILFDRIDKSMIEEELQK